MESNEAGGSAAPPVEEAPYVTVSLVNGREEIATNLPPAQRPLILWLLRKAELTVLTKPSEQEKARLVTPGGLNGLRRRLGLG